MTKTRGLVMLVLGIVGAGLLAGAKSPSPSTALAPKPLTQPAGDQGTPQSGIISKPGTETPLIDLSGDAREIKEAFNKAAGRVRLILFVSPTCPMCQNGAHAVQQKVLDKIESDKLVVFVVWIPILKPDDRNSAQKSIKIISDKRAIRFWDATRNLGTSVAKDMTLPGKTKVAWDLYLVYDAAAEWKDKPPVPADWLHQLGGVKDERRLDGDKLRTSVETLLKK